MLATHCLPFEAVYWTAFGRPPEALLDVSGNEQRVPPTISTGWFPHLDEFPRAVELRSVGIELDETRYRLGLEIFQNSSTQFELGYYSSLQGEENEQRSELLRVQAAEEQTISDYAMGILSQVTAHLNAAVADVYLAVQRGAIHGHAVIVDPPETGLSLSPLDWSWPKPTEPLEPVSSRMKPVAASDWNLDMIGRYPFGPISKPSFSLAALSDTPEPVAWLVLDVEQVVSALPNPFDQSTRNHARFPLPYLVEIPSSEGETDLERAPGRPLKGGPALQKAALHEVQRIKNLGDWPTKKAAQEAIVQAYCNNLGFPVSRSVAQRWLSLIG